MIIQEYESQIVCKIKTGGIVLSNSRYYNNSWNSVRKGYAFE
jgi:hypothetical protein